MNDNNPNPSSPIPPRALLILLVLFLVIPGLCCGGCVVGSYFLPPIRNVTK